MSCRVEVPPVGGQPLGDHNRAANSFRPLILPGRGPTLRYGRGARHTPESGNRFCPPRGCGRIGTGGRPPDGRARYPIEEEAAVLLIFGLSVFFRTVGQGDFHCPGCGGDRHYRQRIARRWFTLFFVPVIPLNRVGEVVECTTCRTRYNLDVLRLPTAREMSAALPAAMRASAAAVLNAGDPSASAARARAVEAVC